MFWCKYASGITLRTLTYSKCENIPGGNMDVEELLKSDLRVHSDGTVTWALDNNVARFLFHTISEGQQTLETGMGLSTVIFALRGSRHIAIAPEKAEVDQIKQFCLDHSISTDNVEFVVDMSDNALPKMDLPPLDLILIDGGHGFPVPYIDWRYTAPHLKTGGILIVDDCQIETGAVLRNFLRCEDVWTEERNFYGRTSVFRLKEPFKLSEFGGQRYGASRNKIRRYISELQKAAYLIRGAEIGALWTGIKKQWK
jgi:methyltransferase family protein